MGQYKQKFVRIGTKSSNDFIQLLNEKNGKIQEIFLNNIKKLTKSAPCKVMLGDSSITEQQSFDPKQVQTFYEQIIKDLSDWSTQNTSITNNEDLRRIFVKFETKTDNYILSLHVSLQYHVLLYYKSDHRVIECQKELSEIMDKTKDGELELKEIGEQVIIDKLKAMGYKDLDHQKLFEVFFENDELREKIYNEIETKTDTDFQNLTKRKTELFKELDDLLIETYQTSSVLIDDAKLISGEEGCLCTFDLEHIKNNIKEGMFDPKKISTQSKEKIIKRFDQVLELMKKI